jgi:drug/metabolite transporter (DMT)-like permease
VSARQTALLGLLAALWGSSYLLIKYALEGFSPAEVVFGRAAIGGLVLVVVARLQGGGVWTAVRAAPRRPGVSLLLGLLFVAAPFLLISYGETAVPSGLTAVLIAPSPIFVALLALRLDSSERGSRGQWIGLAAGFAGVALVVGVETIGSLAQFLGGLGMVAASACYAGGSFVVKRAYHDVPPIATSAIALGAASLLTLVPAAATAHHAAPALGPAAALLALAVTHTAFAFVIFYRLIGEIGAARANLVSYLTPAVALAYGAALRDERVGLATFAGLVLIFTGVALASRRAPAPALPPAEPGPVSP